MAAIPSPMDRFPVVRQRKQQAGPQLRLVMPDTAIPTRRPMNSLPVPPSSFQRLEPTPELLDSLRTESQRLESATPEEIIAWGVERYAPYLTMATAFGPEGCVILAMLANIAPETYVFNLETGYQFQETLDLRDRIAQRYGVEVDLLTPELSVPEYEALHGGPLYTTNPDQCCFDRKIKTLQRASQVMHAWMSGIRRDQSPDRAGRRSSAGTRNSAW